jgi:hypothetical protein
MCRPLIALLLLALCSACTLEKQEIEPTPVLPQVKFTEPENGRQVFEGVNVTVEIEASDELVGIAKLEFYADDQLLQESSIPNYQVEPVYVVQMSWRAEGIGHHFLTAIAYRPDGTPSNMAALDLEVIPREATEEA